MFLKVYVQFLTGEQAPQARSKSDSSTDDPYALQYASNNELLFKFNFHIILHIC